MNLIKRLYEPKTRELGGIYDLVVAVDYATLKPGNKFLLPKAGYATLEKAIQLVQDGRALRIAWANAPRFGTSREESNAEKHTILKWHGLSKTKVLAMVECTNSITEAECILDAVPDATRIILVCDWRHARRLRKIWRYFSRDEIAIVTTNADWDEDHPSFWCTSNLRWLLGNLIHHTLLCVRGVKKLRNVLHPVEA